MASVIMVYSTTDGHTLKICKRLGEVIEQGRKVVLVSSGAVGAGMGRMGVRRRPDDLEAKIWLAQVLILREDYANAEVELKQAASDLWEDAAADCAHHL